jgi:hypothetical protein
VRVIYIDSPFAVALVHTPTPSQLRYHDATHAHGIHPSITLSSCTYLLERAHLTPAEPYPLQYSRLLHAWTSLRSSGMRPHDFLHHTLTHSHTHTLTHSHTHPHNLTASHPRTYSLHRHLSMLIFDIHCIAIVVCLAYTTLRFKSITREDRSKPVRDDSNMKYACMRSDSICVRAAAKEKE